MRLSRDEEAFLQRWIYDEVHYQEGVGAAKRLQIQEHIVPADLAILIAAAFPEPAEQEAAGLNLLTDAPTWPWSEEAFRKRLAEAKATLAQRHQGSQPATARRDTSPLSDRP